MCVSSKPVCCYFDIDHFKPFNDSLGYSKGDEVILSLARQLCTVFNGDNEWVGHIGGDDFVVFSDRLDIRQRCEEVQQLFTLEAAMRYPEAIRQAGFITGEDRDGLPRQFPLVALSVGIVVADSREFGSAADLAATAAVAKSKAKKAISGIQIVSNIPTLDGTSDEQKTVLLA